MKKYLVISNVVLLGIIAFLVYANYLSTPAVERPVSVAEEIRKVDSIAATYKGVVLAEEEIPDCCAQDYGVGGLGHLQTITRHKNGITKFALSWKTVQDFKLEYQDAIMYFGEDGRPVSYRFRNRWFCSKKAEQGGSSIEHIVENPEACLAIK